MNPSLRQILWLQGAMKMSSDTSFSSNGKAGCRHFPHYAVGLALAMLLTGAGCRKPPTEAELGKIVYELPKVPGADHPYPLPQIEEPASSDAGQEADAAAAAKAPAATP